MVVILTDKLCYQIIFAQLFYTVSVWVHGYVRPFDDPGVFRMEIFNEIVMLLILMCMIGFSDIVPSIEGQFVVGYVCSLIIVMHLGVNLILIFKISVKGLIMSVKKWRK